MTTNDLKQFVLELQSIGIDIARQVEASKEIRKTVVALIEELGLGKVTSVEPVEFLIDNLRVTVIQEKGGGKDFTVTFKELKQI